jgi:hypothetical protein
MRRGSAKWILTGLIAFFILIQIVQPTRTNPPVIASRSLEAHVPVPLNVQLILQRTCYNCHSSATIWPWYSHIAPVSWLVVSDVNTARSHINLQDWEAQVNPQEGQEHLGLICKLIRQKDMPPWNYRLMHKDGTLSPEEVETVCAWSQQFAEKEGSEK